MSSSDLAISVRDLSKAYAITRRNKQTHSTLAEQLLYRIRHPFSSAHSSQETFLALNELSFDVEKGQVVGIVGRNGAGKSTLLKILSRITEPTEGTIDLYGRVGSLLEVGTGFHPELTGKENIYLNGQILGMRKREIDLQFDAIVDFAGVEQFLDTPVKRYSSGMYVRLAFAVAAHLESEILVVDEVLAVGDAEFQRKCLGKMKDIATNGRTVLFVSHHMQSVQVLCTRAMFLDQGQITHYGGVDEALHRYASSFVSSERLAGNPQYRPGTGELRFTSVRPGMPAFTCGDIKVVNFKIARSGAFQGKVFVSAHVVNETGVIVAQCDSRMSGGWVGVTDHCEGSFILRTPWLKPGSYRVEMFICSAGIIDRFEDACRLEVLPLYPYVASGNDEAVSNGVVLSDFTFELA